MTFEEMSDMQNAIEEAKEAIITSENLSQVMEKLNLRYGSIKKIVQIMSEHHLMFKIEK